MYIRNPKADIRPELIQKEIAGDIDAHEFKLTKRFISWLFRHYFTFECCENWYDHDEVILSDGSSRPATKDERMTFNNWQDPLFEGAWDFSQKRVDAIAKEMMNDFRKCGFTNRSRCWIGMAKFDDLELLHVYLYGRDIHDFDLHYFMKKRGTETRSQYDSRRYKRRPLEDNNNG